MFRLRINVGQFLVCASYCNTTQNKALPVALCVYSETILRLFPELLVIAEKYLETAAKFNQKFIFKYIRFFQSHYGAGVDSASNRNEYLESSWEVEYGRLLRLTTHGHL
jgi:hypothetical protein